MTWNARTICRTLAATAFLVGWLACSESMAPPVVEASVFAVTISVDRDLVQGGDKVLVTIRATNTSGRRVRFKSPACRLLRFDVSLVGGDRVGGSSRGCFQPAAARKRPDIEVGPGETLEARPIWIAPRFWTNRPAGARRYQIVAEMNIPDGPRSDPVPVTVLAVLAITVNVEPAIADVGDSVIITTVVTNERSPSLIIPDLSSCQFGLWVGRAGSRVQLLTGCSATRKLVVMRPGEQQTRIVGWVAEAPGDYTVLAVLTVHELRPQPLASASLQVK